MYDEWDGSAVTVSNKPLQDNKPIVNTAGDFILGLTHTRYNTQLTFTQIEKYGFVIGTASNMINTVNLNQIKVMDFIIEPEEGLLKQINSKVMNTDKDFYGYPFGRYVKTDYVIEIQLGGWYQKVVNAGFNKYEFVDGNLVHNAILNQDLTTTTPKDPTEKITEIAKLNQEGHPIKLDDAGKETWYKYIWIIPAKDWEVEGTLSFHTYDVIDKNNNNFHPQGA
jgi:hypothetical protein